MRVFIEREKFTQDQSSSKTLKVEDTTLATVEFPRHDDSMGAAMWSSRECLLKG